MTGAPNPTTPFTEATIGNQGSNLTGIMKASNQIESLCFRPFIEPMNKPPLKPQDRGYYFRFLHCGDIRIIRYTLEDNGFREADARMSEQVTMFWSSGYVKQATY
jgi:hypothetical protein